MKEERKKIISLISVGAVLLFLVVAYFTTTEDTVQESFWSLLPPLIAIVLALGTKEVYSSLFIGILSGGLLFSGFSFEGSIRHIFMDSIIPVLSTSANVGIICFLVILGMMVQLINKTGGSRAFGEWTKGVIETRSGAMLATVALGCLIFIDDYFNCLTLGSVMRPVTDKHRISRAKLAYIIDTTAAPICIIAPISSWAAAVSGFVEGEDGMKIFLETIPYNFYALLSICMMLFLIILKVDFASMWVHERNAEEKGDLFTTAERPYGEGEEDKGKTGSIPDMLVPIFLLILSCIIGLIYSGGFFAGADFITAFSHSDAPTGLVLGSFMALVISLIYYLSKKAISFQEAMNCLPEGFRQMVPAILILTFAWSLKAMTDSLGAKEFVSELVEGRADTMLSFLPSFVFLIAVGLSFATGTSWGTFGILIPIVVGVFDKSDYNMMIISISSCMAGAVCGDHCSPISDTTIMSSAGAQCVHLNHVSTQLPYAILVALVSFFAYIMAGFIKNPWVSFSAAAILLFFILLQIKHIQIAREEERQRRKRRVLR
ncbi:MAG: Na+/H+ antiporter NhaC family protein [Oribacterium parvum]|uniref:Na+/H+ antiporter NhaC family protein n=1 Tax=Oribacterium parvum TaxID=1501329 RepID=A0A930DN89_9FIRM|nr:Na+/H+ antiporter NhaC family protein [Oribacterium parvum]